MGRSVLTIARTLPFDIRGGMEEASWSLARALARHGEAVTVLTTAMDHHARVWDLDGVSVHAIDYVPPRLYDRPPYRWWPYFAPAVARYAKRAGFSPDVIHSQSVYVSGFVRRRRRPPIMVTLHGTPMGDYLGGSRERLIQEVGVHHPRVVLQRAAVEWSHWQVTRTLRRVDSIVAVSSVVASMVPGISPTDPRLSVIPNGIDPGRFPWSDRLKARQLLGLPAEAPLLAFIGRVEEYKGVGRLFDVLPRFPGAHLLVAGEGPYSETLRRRAETSPLRDRVHILGNIPDERRPVVLAAADLVCLPSRVEGQPVSLLEALAMGTPVATTRSWVPEPLLPYAAIDEDVFRMVDAGLRLSQKLDRKSVRAAVLTRFTWDHIAQRYLDLFDGLRARRA